MNQPKQTAPIPSAVPAATPDNLVRLLIANLDRLKAIEGEVARLAGESDRLERRFSSTENRIVGIADHLALLHMHLSTKPHGAKVFWLSLAAQWVGITAIIAGFAIGHFLIKW